MSTERWEHIKRVFNAAMERPAAERTAFVEETCGDDAELKREVLSLIQAARPTLEGGPVRTAGAVNAFANASPSAFTAVQLTERAGSVVGHYKLLQSIGEGGFGTVFLADQTAPVRRRVALKIIKLGMDTRSVVARFEAERQALALMDHPNIARVFEAGSTDSGRPYFVMEYVKGDPITLFADAHTLALRERLELLTQVCHAVQHAHQKGVIHRDIKPSNVLVSMVDGKPLAKVIDFGIAKATGAAGGTLTDKTLFTEHRALIGTPEYMSPEQAEGSPDIDTRTDVYGLGVLMYELLTGTTPFEPSRLRSAAYAEMQRIIKEEEPPSPSLRISRDLQRDLQQLASTAAHRKVEPQRLNTLMRGELDWIVMKALDKDRARRFATPQDLAADIDRHLRGEAVVAAPASAGYRLRKFVRRNKGMVGAVSAVILALAAGGGVAAWQWTRAARANSRLTKDQADVVSTLRASIDNMVGERSVFQTTDFPISISTNDRKVLFFLNSDDTSEYETSVVLAEGSDAQLSNSELSLRPPSELSTTQAAEVLADAVYAASSQAKLNLEKARLSADVAEWSAYTANLALAQAAMDAGNYPEARKRLADAPASKRGWEWKFAQHDAASVIWTTNEPSLSATAIRHDGQEIAISNRDRIDIRLAADGTLLRVLHVDLRDSMSVADLSYSADGKLLVAAGTTGGSAYLLNADNGDIIRRISDLPAACWSATISPDGLRLATSAARQIDVWDVPTGENISRCTLKDTYAQLLRFSADGTHLLFVDFQHERVNALVTGSCEQIPASSSEVLAMKELLRDRPWGIAPNEAGLVTDMKNGRMSGSDSMSFERLLRVSSQSAAGGPTLEFVAYNDEDDQLLSLRVAAILASSPGGPSGLTITTPDGTRRIVGGGEGSDKTVRFYEAKPEQTPAASTASPDAPAAAPAPEPAPRELAVFRMPTAVTNLQMTADGTRLIISLADGSARIWDIREPEERRKDMQAKWAERVPAGQYLDSQWSTQVPTPKLRDTIIADATLTPLRRLVAVEMLQERIEETNRAAEEARNTLTKDATPNTDPATIQAAAAATDLPPRVKDRLISLVADWKPPTAIVDTERKLAEETVKRQTAEANAIRLQGLAADATAFNQCATFDSDEATVTFTKPATAAAIRHLATCKGVDEIILNGSGYEVSAETLKLLAAIGPGASNVKALTFDSASVDAIGLTALAAEDSGLKNITTLTFSNVAISLDGVNAISDPNAGFKNLTSLTFFIVTLSDEAFTSLARKNTALRSLRSLDLKTMSITTEGLSALAETDCGLKDLQSLNFQNVRVSTEGIKALASAQTGLRNLKSLTFYSTPLTKDGFTALADGNSGLKKLTTLDLSLCAVTDESLEILARADTGLTNLTKLKLTDPAITTKGMQSLAAKDTGLKNLTAFILASTTVTPELLSVLAARDTGLSKLTSLDLSYSSVDAAGLRIIAADETGLDNLAKLVLGGPTVSDAELSTLADYGNNLKNLTSLSLNGTKITVEGLKALTKEDTGLRGLTSLKLSQSTLTAEGLKTIARKDTGLKNLASLDLSYCNVTDEGAIAIAATDTGLKNLTSFDLSYSSVTDRGLSALAATDTGLRNLSELTFWGCDITDRGIESLTKSSTGLTNLSSIDFSYCNVTDTGLQSFASASSGLKKLRSVTLYGNYVTEPGTDALRTARPDLKITR